MSKEPRGNRRACGAVTFGRVKMARVYWCMGRGVAAPGVRTCVCGKGWVFK